MAIFRLDTKLDEKVIYNMVHYIHKCGVRGDGISFVNEICGVKGDEISLVNEICGVRGDEISFVNQISSPLTPHLCM
jgi:DNA primase